MYTKAGQAYDQGTSLAADLKIKPSADETARVRGAAAASSVRPRLPLPCCPWLPAAQGAHPRLARCPVGLRWALTMHTLTYDFALPCRS
jgi:hypothetical protein